MWFYYIISLVIISNKILLNLLIVFTYHLIFIGLFSWIIKPYLFIIKNWLMFIILFKNILIYYFIIDKRNHLLFFYSFDFYLLIFYLLRLIFFLSKFIRIWIISLSFN